MADKYRLSVTRAVGHTTVSLECPPIFRDDAVAHALKILDAMPESTFQGDGVVITSVPGHGPDMDGPQGFRRLNPDA